MIHLTLRQLRYFDAVARHGHFGRAAEVCAVTQPALSMQIKELEASLGGTLFERNARRVTLTAFGKEAAARVHAILRGVDDLADLARMAGTAMVRELRLGMIPTVAPYLLPTLVADLTSAYPDLELHVRETTTPKLLRELADGRLDTAIVALPVSEPSLVEWPLFSEPFLPVRPAGDASKPVPNGEALSEMRLLLLEEGHCFRDQALSFCKLDARLPRDILDASSLTTLVQMVGAGIGVTLVPEMAVPVETRAANVSLARFAAPAPSRTIGMVWRRSNPLEPHLEKIAGVVGAAARGAPPEPAPASGVMSPSAPLNESQNG